MSELQPTLDDRLLASLRALIRAEFPTATFLGGLYEFVVTATDGTTLDGTPTDPSLPLPPLNKIPIGSLAEGGVSKPAIGTMCLVEFVNGDPSRPVVSHIDPMVQTATLDAGQVVNIGPTAVNPVRIGPGPYQSAARVGDSIQIFFPIGLFTGTVTSGGIVTPLTSVPCQIVTPAPAIVVSGNNEVLA